MGRPKAKQSRSTMITIRMSGAEAAYLALAASKEAMGPMDMGPFFRGVGMQRTAQLLGVSYADFQDMGKGTR